MLILILNHKVLNIKNFNFKIWNDVYLVKMKDVAAIQRPKANSYL